MLKEHVVFESYSSKTAEDWRAHELMWVRTETIDDVYIKDISHSSFIVQSCSSLDTIMSTGLIGGNRS